MTDTALPLPLTLASGVDRIFPTLTPAQVQRIAVHGQVRSIRAEEVLFEAGEHVVPFFVVTAGRVGMGLPSGTTEKLVTVFWPGPFTREGNMLFCPPRLRRSRASEGGQRVRLGRGTFILLVA